MGTAPVSAIRRAVRASLWLALAFTALTVYLTITEPGVMWAMAVLISIPPMFAAYFAAALPPAWLAFKLDGRWRQGRWRAAVPFALAGVVALGMTVPFSIFQFCVPHYFTPVYRAAHVERVASADFVAPWGARMIALEIPAQALLKQRARILWVAEIELARSEYARLMGKPVEGDPQLPMTSLSREQLEAVLQAMNRAAAGRYRLPTTEEMRLYSGDWWINRYPKWLFRCRSNLGAVDAQPANGLGLRGTVDNAAQLVSSQPAERTTYCVSQGSVEPFCGRERVDGGSRYKSVGLSACDDRSPDKVWSHPAVGVRVVFSVD